MAEHNDPVSLKEHFRTVVTRGIAVALLLAVLSLGEYYLASKYDNPTWVMVPFMVAKGALILDTFMHIRALRNDGAH